MIPVVIKQEGKNNPHVKENQIENQEQINEKKRKWREFREHCHDSEELFI